MSHKTSESAFETGPTVFRPYQESLNHLQN